MVWNGQQTAQAKKIYLASFIQAPLFYNSIFFFSIEVETCVMCACSFIVGWLELFLNITEP